MNWFKKYKTAYDNETAYLNKVLENGFDPYDYEYEVASFLDEFDTDFTPTNNDAEPYEIGEEWINQASKENIKKFEEWIDNRHPNSVDESFEPPSRHFTGNEIIKPQWLVHFTDDAGSIEQSGFQYGHDDYRGLGLTTYKSEKGRKERPGFNFALELGRYANFTAAEGNYGKEAVIFWGSGVKTYHSGDQQDQVIFWGPSVNPNMIFPIYKNGEGWYVEMANGREVNLDDPSFENVSDWVTQNWRMMQQTQDKQDRSQRDRLKR